MIGKAIRSWQYSAQYTFESICNLEAPILYHIPHFTAPKERTYIYEKLD